MINPTCSLTSGQSDSVCLAKEKRISNKLNKNGSPHCASGSETSNGFPKNVRFSTVVVYSFAREQGFSSVPDTGWCSLGMSRNHHSVSRYDIHHHQLLQRLRRRRRRLQKPRLTSGSTSLAARIRGRCRNVGKSGTNRSESPRLSPGDSCRVPVFASPPPLSPQMFHDRTMSNDPSNPAFFPSDVDVQATPPPPCLSPPSPRRVLAHYDDLSVVSNSLVFPEGLDTDSEASLDQVPSVNRTEGAKTSKSHGKLMPIHGAARIRILKEAGVSRLDESERDVCLRIRATRSCVGCNCGPRYPCLPGRCPCADEGIQCQVDRASFPCSCSADQCHNPHGRTEFSQEQVRAYVQSVISRFSKQKEEPLDEHNHYRSSLVPEPSGDSEPRFALPNPVVTARRQSTEAQAGMEQACQNTSTLSQTDKNDRNSCSSPSDSQAKSNSSLTGISAPNDVRLMRQPTMPVIGSAQSPKWISSTPAPSDPANRRLIFSDSNVSTEHMLDLSVPVTRMKSPKSITQFPNSMTPPRTEDEVIDLTSPEPKYPPQSPITTPLNVRRSRSPGLSRIKRNCRTPIHRKRVSENAVRSENHFPRKSLGAIWDSHIPSNLPLGGKNNVLNITGNTVRLPDSSSEWFSEMAPSAPSHTSHSPTHSSVPLRWDTIQDTTQVHLATNPSPNLEDSRIPLLRNLLSIASTSVSPSRTKEQSEEDSAPRSPTVKLINRFHIPNYASYRMKAIQFISKSAPNSPCSGASPSLGRLSLRHRAIPRLPVTPSRRVPRSPRTPNFRFSRKSQSNSPSLHNSDIDSNRTPNRVKQLDKSNPNSPRTPGKPRRMPPQTTCATVIHESSAVPDPTTLPRVSSSS